MKLLLNKLFLGLAILVFVVPSVALGAGNTDMEILGEKLKADKKLLIAVNMALTEDEAKDFWPLYDAYQKELQTVNHEIGRLIVEFAEAYVEAPIPNDKAKKIRNDVLALEEKEVQLKQTYGDKMDKVLPAWKVTRYLQIENKIRALIKFELAKRIPLTY